MDFGEFFEAIWGTPPFPWQERLADRVKVGKWPQSIGLPTAAGKTALIDMAVWALAIGAPAAARRIFFIVDRRIIVDEAAERAQQLAQKLCDSDPAGRLGKVAAALREIAGGENPLSVAVLRGGISRDDWTTSPLQPTVICSTVDQVGSSLLFRGYGTNEYNWPIRAGLAAYDSLIILDEAHNSQPFAETLVSIRQYRDWASHPLVSPMTTVEMSATPRTAEAFREDRSDLNHPVLKKRWEAEKRARMVLVDPQTNGGFSPLIEAMTKEARGMRDEHDAKVIGVVVNRVTTARRIHSELAKDKQTSDAILLIGRGRAYDRDRIWHDWKDKIGLQRKADPERPVFVVATQCIEVGVNISFDALVTEIASIDALEQRFGRLDRDGRMGLTHAAIVAQKDQVRSGYRDSVYDSAMPATWAWLQTQVVKQQTVVIVPAEGKKKPKQKKITDRFVPMGVLSLRQALASIPERESLLTPRTSAPVLLPANMDLFCQTSPTPAVSPDPAIYLHGSRTGPADVQVIWRVDLQEDAKVLWPSIVAICPPSAAEALSLPVWAVKAWLSEWAVPGMADLEGMPDQDLGIANKPKSVLCWKGPDESEVITADRIQPGMTVVVPATYGGCDEWGWDPGYGGVVTDIGDVIRLRIGRPVLRLHPLLAESHGYAELAKSLREADDEEHALESLKKIDISQLSVWVAEAVAALAEGRLKLVSSPVEGDESIIAITGYGPFHQESNRASFTKKVLLMDHLDGSRRWAESFSTGLPERLKKTVIRALELHDIGKLDPRFQAWLNGGNPILDQPVAKSERSAQNSGAIERARVLAGYPKGGRHELLSVGLLSNSKAMISDVDYELLLHLIGSHHGRCRPFAPIVQDPDPREVSYNGWTASTNHKLEEADSGVSERFWRLIRRYGWYGLSYLEALVRLADHRRSEEETRVSN